MKKTITTLGLCIGLWLASSPWAVAGNLKDDAEVIVNKARVVIDQTI